MTARKPTSLTTRQVAALTALATGQGMDKAASYLYDPADDPDGRKRLAARKKVRELQRDPVAMEFYRSILRSVALDGIGRAVAKLVEQIDDPAQPWIAQGAAREMLARFLDDALGRDQAETVIRIEGLPDLGTPDEEGPGAG